MTKRKALLTLLLVATSFIAQIALTQFIPIAYGDGENWLTGWDYRKSLTIENTTGAGTGYQVKLVVHYGSGSDYVDNSTSPPEAHIYLTQKGLSSFNDIRFTDNDGSTQLDYLFFDKDEDIPTDARWTGTYVNIYPLAYYYDGVTYIAYQKTNSLDPYVSSYNHSTGLFSTPVDAGNNPLSGDGHGHPAIIRDDNGYIHVFFGCHGTVMKHSKSDNPDDISAWTAQADPVSVATYPNVVRTGDDTFYLIYRKFIGADNFDVMYKRTTDNFASFDSETQMLDMDSKVVYPCSFVFDETNNVTHMTWFWCESGVKHDNGYHGYLNHTDSMMYSTNGTNLGSTITLTEADTYCKFLTYSDYPYQPFSTVRLDSSGYPRVMYFDGNATYIKWDGSSWSSPVKIADGGSRWCRGDFVINTDSNLEALVTEADNCTYKYTSIDAGSNWGSGTLVLTAASSSTGMWLPRLVLNYTDDFKFIVGEYKLDYTTSINVRGYGDSGETMGDLTGTFFVELQDNLNSSSATIYVYYGESGVSTTSNGENTFPWLFDDLDNYSVGEAPNSVDWERTGQDASDPVNVQLDPADSNKKVFKITETGDAINTGLIGSFKDYRSGFAFQYRQRTSTDTDGQYHHYLEDATIVIATRINDVSNRFEQRPNGGYTDYSPQWSRSLNTWYVNIAEIQSDYFHVVSGGTDYTGGIWNTPTSGVNETTWVMSGGAASTIYYYIGGQGNNSRYIFTRKFVNPDPEFTVWGSEETDPSLLNSDPTVTSFVISDLSDGGITMFKTLWYRPIMVVDDANGLSDIGTSYFAFQTDYGWHNVSYNYQTDVYAVETATGNIIVADGYTEFSGTSLTIHFYLMLLESIDVDTNVDVYCRVTDVSSGDSDWSLEQLDYFNIEDYTADETGSSGWTPSEVPSEEPQEIWIDSDGDGIPNWDDPDVDGDGIPNEYDEDIDGDDIPNNIDPEPFIPEEVDERPILLSFKTPSGKIINIINPLYYLKPYQKIIIPLLFLLLALILYSIYRNKSKKSLDERVSDKITTLGGSVFPR